MRDATSFLTGHPPFDKLDAATVARLAQRARQERYPAGTTIFEQGSDPPGVLRVVCEGAVELVDRARGAGMRGHDLPRAARGGRASGARRARRTAFFGVRHGDALGIAVTHRFPHVAEDAP